MRFLLAACVLVVILSAVVSSAATLKVDGGVLQVFVIPASIPTPSPVLVMLDLKPDSLGKKSEGTPITAFIKLPSPYAADQIDVASLRLACVAPTGAGGCSSAALGVDPKGKPKTEDSDGYGIEDTLKVTFDRQAMIELVRDVKTPALVEFAVTGRVSNAPFEGRDVVKLVDPEATPTAAPTPTARPTRTATPTQTATPTATATAAGSAAATVTSTSTPLPTATPSPKFTVTPTPTGTATATRTSTPVPLPNLLTPTAGPTGTAVLLPPIEEATATGTPEPLPTPTPTATTPARATPVPTPTIGPTPMPPTAPTVTSTEQPVPRPGATKTS